MKKEMYQVSVSNEGGKIYITQENQFRDEDECICLTPEQTRIVARWLEKALEDTTKIEVSNK